MIYNEFNTLEDILIALGSKKPFKKNGELSVSGGKAYGKLTSILYDSAKITDKRDTIHIVDTFDEIIWRGE